MSKYEPKSSLLKNVPKMGICWTIRKSKRKYYQVEDDHITRYWAKVPVWCPVVRNTFFVARREGQVFVTGNTPVSLQELYYGHYMDMLNEGKVDPFRPISDDAIKEFTSRATGGQLPEWNREHYAESRFQQPDTSIAADEEPVDKGDLPQILGLRNAHLLMPYLEHLTARHKDDTQGIAAELMDMKAESNRYKTATDAARRKGKEYAKPAPEHQRILGYGPKLTRYLLGMMGGGNMIVPDRHMVRSTFDLHMDHDADVLNKLQTQVVTKAHNEKLLRAIDHNFFVKHPAVKHVLETFPRHFQGRESQAIFPAFWLHWLTIGHYDRMRGRPSMAFNADTDHGVFWDSVRDEMIKHGLNPHPLVEGRVPADPTGDEDESFDFGQNVVKKSEKPLDPWPRHHALLDQPTWLKAAGCVEALRQRWGETPALLALYSHIAPKLLEAETPVPPVTHRPSPTYHPHLFKAEALAIDLKKAIADANQEHPALGEVAPQIHHVYFYHPGPDLKIRRHPSGRFTTAGNHVNTLEDYHGHLKGTLSDGPIDEHLQQQLENLQKNHKLEVVPFSDIRDGKRPELWEFQAPVPESRPKVFEYLRQGQSRPDTLEYIGGAAHLNGHPLDREQTQALVHHVKNGHASVRYKKDKGQAIKKMELVLAELLKGEDPGQAAAVHEALGRLDELVRAGHLDPRHAEALRQHAFKDPMTGHVMGNKFAYTDFKNRGDAREGIHLVMDGNDFKSINDRYGHETGDKAIKAMGQAMREAMDETVGPEQGKLFRVGGDEFAAHVPTHEHAAQFARALRNRLEALTPIQGQHRLSMGMGIGTSPEQADQALYEAKKQKYDPAGMTHPDSRKWISKYSPGTTPSLAHSLVPGFEGPVPLHQGQLPIKPPPAPEPRPEALAPMVHTAPPPQPGAELKTH